MEQAEFAATQSHMLRVERLALQTLQRQGQVDGDIARNLALG